MERNQNKNSVFHSVGTNGEKRHIFMQPIEHVFITIIKIFKIGFKLFLQFELKSKPNDTSWNDNMFMIIWTNNWNKI